MRNVQYIKGTVPYELPISGDAVPISDDLHINPILVGPFVPPILVGGANMPPSGNEPKNEIWEKS